MNVSFLSDLLSTISDRGRQLIERRLEAQPPGERQAAFVIELAEQLLSRRGEASGVAIAGEILAAYAGLEPGPRIAVFETLEQRFGTVHERLTKALEAYIAKPGDETAQDIHYAAEPRRQELFRRINLAPGGTPGLVAMRKDLLDILPRRPDLQAVDSDLMHLFSSWFNRGFLVVRRIDWTTSANILEKIIRYEAVHEIRGWDDLRRRLEPVDRRCFAFFHPALVDEPLIFVEVALTRDIPAAIAPLLSPDRKALAPAEATTAVFYSISNCQEGLKGISFGNFLIKQVAYELKRELPGLERYVTLSPVPGFGAWLDGELAGEGRHLTREDREALRALAEPEWWSDPARVEALRRPLLNAAAAYFLRARNAKGRVIDPVARFHLGNGARLEQLDVMGDVSPKGLRQSKGLMVNYLYDLGHIERNHEAYANQGTVTASSRIQKLVRPEPKTTAAPTQA